MANPIALSDVAQTVQLTKKQGALFIEAFGNEIETARLERRPVDIDGFAALLCEGVAHGESERRAAAARLIGPPRPPAIKGPKQNPLLPPKVCATQTFPMVRMRRTRQ